MTASLPAKRLQQIEEVRHSRGDVLTVIPGPERHETIKRYQRLDAANPWEEASALLRRGGKVLWVVNTVDEAIRLYESDEAKSLNPHVYHSRFRYVDRVARHQSVIEAFKGPGPVLAFCTQVAEMSLDISADLLVTQLAPIPSLIQRLGRLNRRAQADDPWPFIALRREPGDRAAPYSIEQLSEASEWLESLGSNPVSQRELATAWKPKDEVVEQSLSCAWIDGGFETKCAHLREGSPGIDIILHGDAERVASRLERPERVRIPMTVPRSREWRNWPEVAFCKVPPAGIVDYDPQRGARWKV